MVDSPNAAAAVEAANNPAFQPHWPSRRARDHDLDTNQLAIGANIAINPRMLIAASPALISPSRIAKTMVRTGAAGAIATDIAPKRLRVID